MRHDWEFGLAMEGCDQVIKQALLAVTPPADRPYHYVELGIAEGQTLAGVARFLEAWPIDFRVTGVDIEGGWSLKAADVLARLAPFQERAEMLLVGSHDYLTLYAEPDSIDFLLIDACHAKECCMTDFLEAEEKVRIGGIACFHDTCRESQGSEIQPHCRQPIGVRAAVRDLGLLHGTRPGWRVWRETFYLPGRDSRGMLFVQRMARSACRQKENTP